MDILIKISIKISLKSWYFIMPPFLKFNFMLQNWLAPFLHQSPVYYE